MHNFVLKSEVEVQVCQKPERTLATAKKGRIWQTILAEISFLTPNQIPLRGTYKPQCYTACPLKEYTVKLVLHRPQSDKREFIKISQAVGIGFVVMGAIGMLTIIERICAKYSNIVARVCREAE
ncbi:MAG: hypothetical protein Q9181_001585 [Wetmoreana brouardii]